MAIQEREETYSSELKSIIDSLNFGFKAKVELILPNKKMPDVVLFDEAQKPVLIIEVKKPEEHPYVNDPEVLTQVTEYAETVRKRTQYSNIRFVATHNLRYLMLFQYQELKRTKISDYAEEAPKWRPVRAIPWPVLPEATKLVEYNEHLGSIKRAIQEFLLDFKSVLEGKGLSVRDEKIISELSNYILRISDKTGPALYNLVFISKRSDLREIFDKWRAMRDFPEPSNSQEARDQLAKLSLEWAYTLTLKLMFYHVLRVKHAELSRQLANIRIDGSANPDVLKAIIDSMFKDVVERIGESFSIIYETNSLEKLPISASAVPVVADLFNYVREINWREFEYDVVGRILERMLGEERRHLLGQYFTRSDVVDLLLSFALRKAGPILDPAVGSGTFLVRAYQRLRYLDSSLNHQQRIDLLYGVEIEKASAMLAVINLYIRDPQIPTAPKITYKDFFSREVEAGSQVVSFPPSRPDSPVFGFSIPRMQAVVANPPYTAQREMGFAFSSEYTKSLVASVIDPLVKAQSLPGWSERASIYTYFFLKGTTLLTDNGRLGFITSNSWLDTGFGAAVQQYFLRNFALFAIIQSNVERWFEDADVITALTIVGPKQNKGYTKFVSVKKNLRDLIGHPTTGIDPVEAERYWHNLDQITEEIEKAEEVHKAQFLRTKLPNSELRIFEDERFRIIAIKQENLENDSKWGKFLRAPTAYFKAVAREGFFQPLSEVLEVKRGFTTNANEFYYWPSQYWSVGKTDSDSVVLKNRVEGTLRIPSKYAKRLVKGPQQLPAYSVREKDLKELVFHITDKREALHNLDARRYVDWMEKTLVDEYLQSDGKKNGTLVQKILAPEFKHRQAEEQKKPETTRKTGDTILKEIAKDFASENHSKIEWNENWYVLPEREAAPFLAMRGTNDRFVIWYNASKALEDQRLCSMNPVTQSLEPWLLFAILNNSLTHLSMELNGRTSLGEGALDIAVEDYDQIPLIRPTKILEALHRKPSLRGDLMRTSQDMMERSVLPIGQELNQNDRMKLDVLVLKEILGLKEGEVDEIRKALVSLSRDRLERAQSLKEKTVGRMTRRRKVTTQTRLVGANGVTD